MKKCSDGVWRALATEEILVVSSANHYPAPCCRAVGCKHGSGKEPARVTALARRTGGLCIRCWTENRKRVAAGLPPLPTIADASRRSLRSPVGIEPVEV